MILSASSTPNACAPPTFTCVSSFMSHSARVPDAGVLPTAPRPDRTAVRRDTGADGRNDAR